MDGKRKPNILMIGLIAVAAIAFLIFARGFGGRGEQQGQIPVSGGRPGGSGANQGSLGDLFVALSVDQNGCPIETTEVFFPDEPILAGLRESNLPAGTQVFARLYREGRVLEDSPAVTADRTVRNSCVWFEFSPGRDGFVPGEYQVEMYVNGSQVGAVRFSVDEQSGSGDQGLSHGTAAVELGRVYTSTAVDQNGCPADSVDEFYPDEAIYVAVEESFIPAGTQIFARLVYEGEPVEDTDPVVAPRDTEACVWFVFEAQQAGSNMDRGYYEAQVIVDGNLAETVEFQVR